MILKASLASKLAHYHTDEVFDFECWIAHAACRGETSYSAFLHLDDAEKKYLTDAGYKIEEGLRWNVYSGADLWYTTISWGE